MPKYARDRKEADRANATDVGLRGGKYRIESSCSRYLGKFGENKFRGDNRSFKLRMGENDSTAFLPLKQNWGGLVRYVKDGENICPTVDQTRYIYKKVEQYSIVYVETIKQDIEDDRLDKDNDKEENPYQNIFMNDYEWLKEEDRQVIELDFCDTLVKLKGEYLDMYDGIRSEVLCTTKFDENSDLSMTYLGRIDMTRLSIWHKVRILTKRNKFVIKFISFCQVINTGFIRCEGKCFSHQHVGIVVENFILNKIILFILYYFILLYPWCCGWVYY